MIVGISGGDYPTRGFLDAYDPKTGKRIWRFYTVPGPGEPGSETWPASPERAGARRRRHLGHRQLRSGTEHALLGHRQSQSRLLRRGSERRQPLHLLADRDRRRHRQAEVVLPVHPARPPRLGLEPRAGAGRSDDRRSAAQGRHGGEPQRILLRARPRHRARCCSASRSRTPRGRESSGRTVIRSSSTTAAKGVFPTTGAARTSCRRPSIRRCDCSSSPRAKRARPTFPKIR